MANENLQAGQLAAAKLSFAHLEGGFRSLVSSTQPLLFGRLVESIVIIPTVLTGGWIYLPFLQIWLKFISRLKLCLWVHMG